MYWPFSFTDNLVAQKIMQTYQDARPDSVRIGYGNNVFLKYISRGYSLAIPDSLESIAGMLIFLEDSKYNNRNDQGKQIYSQANEAKFAVLSISSEIPLDIFFADSSLMDLHHSIEHIIRENRLPNKNIFFSWLGFNRTQYFKIYNIY